MYEDIFSRRRPNGYRFQTFAANARRHTDIDGLWHVQGYGTDADRLNRHFGFNPQRVDFLLVSHAHIDHTGLIPLLVKQGFKGSIYCTPATRDLMEIMLLDSAKIQEDDTRYLNKRRQKQGQPFFPKPCTIPTMWPLR